MPLPKEMIKINDGIWELPKTFREGMRVPGRIFGSEKIINAMEEQVFEQVANVAKLPGIVGYSFCMPDGHWGYGFPIGGVAAMDVDEGIISPGGIGFDINCGMRLITTNLTEDDVKPKIELIVNKLFKKIPCGVGEKGFLRINKNEFKDLIKEGSKWCIDRGFGWKEDEERTEEQGAMKGADPANISDKAVERGYKQVGTLGSGNHYLEIQVAKPENIIDKELAQNFGITIPNQIVIMFHCGSRGFGHQVATDYLELFLKVMKSKYNITLYDRELSCAPFNSSEGQRYYSAMKCAVNMAFANRQLILHRIREVFSDVFGKKPEELNMHQIYDVAHNIAKEEKHDINGKEKKLLIHRKGATRAFAPGMEGLPDKYKKTGQPIIIGGSMETGSYLLVGVKGAKQSFYSTAHGSGRVMSRHQAKKMVNGRTLLSQLKERGIYINTSSFSGLAEEAGSAYKNIDDVVEAVEIAGLSKPVARFIPIGNIKG